MNKPFMIVSSDLPSIGCSLEEDGQVRMYFDTFAKFQEYLKQQTPKYMIEVHE